MGRIRIFPYSSVSKSAKVLAEALGGKRLKLEGSSFVKKDTDLIINWGNRSCPYPLALNAGTDPAADKLKFLQRMKDSGNEDIIPRFWTSESSIPDDAFPIVCRTLLSGHSGAGIHIADSRDDLVPAPLYVQYIKKIEEYRVHLGRIKDSEDYSLICIQKKARRVNCPNPNWQIRSHDNGFVFVRNNLMYPNCVVSVSHKAIRACGLDFGAIDVIYNANQSRAYVLEINTAPGLEGQTIQDYATFFRTYQ